MKYHLIYIIYVFYFFRSNYHLMDNVIIILFLLAIGLIILCLCCYKISNLLYILYHIEDSNSQNNDEETMFCDDIHIDFVSNYAAATAAAASGNMPEINETSMAKRGETEALLLSDIAFASVIENMDVGDNNTLKVSLPAL